MEEMMRILRSIQKQIPNIEASIIQQFTEQIEDFLYEFSRLYIQEDQEQSQFLQTMLVQGMQMLKIGSVLLEQSEPSEQKVALAYQIGKLEGILQEIRLITEDIRQRRECQKILWEATKNAHYKEILRYLYDHPLSSIYSMVRNLKINETLLTTFLNRIEEDQVVTVTDIGGTLFYTLTLYGQKYAKIYTC